MMFLLRTNKKAASFMEYALILALVSAVLIGMNIYIKRGIQGRVREMSDYFISQEHLVEINPTVSDTNTISTANQVEEGFIGGGTRLALSDRKSTVSSSTVEDRDTLYSSPFIPSDSGNVTPPGRDDDEEYIDPDWETETDIRILERDRDRLLMQATMKEEQAQVAEDRGNELIAAARRMRCRGRRRRRCKRARQKMYEAGQQLLDEAAALRLEAQELRALAARIQQRIDELRATLS